MDHIGVTAADAAEDVPMPAWLNAYTLTVWAVPLDTPEIMHVVAVAATVQALLPGVAVAV